MIHIINHYGARLSECEMLLPVCACVHVVHENITSRAIYNSSSEDSLLSLHISSMILVQVLCCTCTRCYVVQTAVVIMFIVHTTSKHNREASEFQQQKNAVKIYVCYLVVPFFVVVTTTVTTVVC